MATNKRIERKLIPYVAVIFSVSILIYSIGPYLNTTRFIVPVADDLQLKRLVSGENYIVYAYECMRDIYYNWQGDYVSEFLYAFFNPLSRIGIEGIRLACFLAILFFYACLWICVRNISLQFFKQSETWKIFAAYAMIALLISNARCPSEVFFWYTGICVYTIPVGGAMLGVGLLIRYLDVPRRRYLIGAMVCGFVAGGGVLQCAGLICYFYLLLAVWAKLKRKPQWVAVLTAFGVALLSTLVNVCAPGNYVRHGVMEDSNLHVFLSIRYSVAVVGWEIIRLLRETDFLPFVVVFIIVGCVIGRGEKTIKLWHIGTLIVSLLGAACVCVYPVILGYSNTWMPERAYFILDVGIVIFAAVGSVVFGSFISYYCTKITDRYLYILMGMVIVILGGRYVFWGGEEIIRPIELCFYEYQSRIYERFRDGWEYVYQYIEETDEKNIVVEVKEIPKSSILMNPHISEDSSYWVNGMVRTYYNKDSVSVRQME